MKKKEKELSFSYKLYIISNLVTVCLPRSYFVVRINNKIIRMFSFFLKILNRLRSYINFFNIVRFKYKLPF